ncbi:SAM-dependent methyltransferase [Sphaerisporangium siamense]|uniref:SAM-dependent methyltransferase n=1 Tax=Sphaerisporangium siamense TaxID=795645 RepID=A0A7W7GAK0_9ACTN|nr:methyltransferase domain-containing protein [Sphaerisporangium siamense]MBB4701514.1 SAM-dependent methyltransferase [Sphaerisporangium siamense]
MPGKGGAAIKDDGHYALDVVGAHYGLSGGGLHIYFTGDLLHPPMAADARVWADGRLWRQGAADHVMTIADLAGLREGERVLDVGCGLGGPARLLARACGVTVTSVTNSHAHAVTAHSLNQREPDWHDRITVVLADGQEHLPCDSFDVALSINMLYQVRDHRALFTRVFEALAPGGRFVVDDWMLTSQVTEADLSALTAHFTYPHFARVPTIEDDLLAAGFPPAEKMIDFGHVARGPMAEHFERQVRDHFAPRIITDWPGDPVNRPGIPAYGALMVEEFVAAVNLTIELYRNRHMTYRRLMVRKG